MMVPYIITSSDYVFFVPSVPPVKVDFVKVGELGILEALEMGDKDKLMSILDELTMSDTKKLKRLVETFDNLRFVSVSTNDEVPVVTVAWVDAAGAEHTLPPVMADLLTKMYQSGETDFSHYFAFIDKIMQIKNEHTREELYSFLQVAKLPINDVGNFIAYKGVEHDFWSCRGNRNTRVLRGTTDSQGRILNKVGDVIEVNRDDVEDNCEVGCAPGLHVGSYEYASGYGTTVVAVEVDPRDVVSVPTDCACQKCRVSKYRVFNIIENYLGMGTAKVDDDLHVEVDDIELDDFEDDDEPEEVTPAQEMLALENVESVRAGITRNIATHAIDGIPGSATTVGQLAKSVGRKYNARVADMASVLLALGFSIESTGSLGNGIVR